MSKKSKHRRARHLGRAQTVSTLPQSEIVTPGALPASSARRNTLIAGVIGVVCAAAGVYAWQTNNTSLAPAKKPQVIEGDGVRGPAGMVWVPGGEFLMGSDHKLAQKNERPAHKVRVSGFWMDRTHVTNAQFAAFVKATGYVTTAERKPDWETLARAASARHAEAAGVGAGARRDGVRRHRRAGAAR